MKLSSYLQSLDDLQTFEDAGVSELILEPKVLSRFGELSLEEVNEFSKILKSKGIRCLLEWDILMTEDRFKNALHYLDQIQLENFSAIRVQDPGAFYYVLEKYPGIKIQLILETGNHNLKAIKTWASYAGDRLERVALSLELPKERLKEFTSKLEVPVEFLGLGRILLFYTPRNLVSPHFVDHDEPETKKIHQAPIEVSGSSEESPHHGFPIVENMHGTFMFNTKDHCLLENLDELEHDIGISSLRIDLRFLKDKSFIKAIAKLQQNFDKDKALELKKEYPGRVIRGFYSVNKTDVLFGKLKNRRIQRKDESYLGDVIEVVKKKHIAIMLRNPKLNLNVKDKIRFHTPDGKEKLSEVRSLWNSEEKNLEQANHEQVIFIPHIGGVSIRTAVYLD